MNGNSPDAQEYGHACDAAADRLIPHIEKLPEFDAIQYALSVAEEGGANRKMLIQEFMELITSSEEFGIGALKGGH